MADHGHDVGSDVSLPEATRVTVFCPECSEIVVVVDAHAFVLGLHQRVCGELAAVNGEE
jgi:hypothetical protein